MAASPTVYRHSAGARTGRARRSGVPARVALCQPLAGHRGDGHHLGRAARPRDRPAHASVVARHHDLARRAWGLRAAHPVGRVRSDHARRPRAARHAAVLGAGPRARCRSRGCGRPACWPRCCCRRWSSACCWCSWSARSRRSGTCSPALHLSATDTFLALVIAQVYESAPYYILGAQAAFASIDPRLEQQAALLGDRPRRVFRRVTVPLAAPGLAMALAIAWARAMGAFGAVVIIAYHPTALPLQIWTSLQETGLAVGPAVRPRPARCRPAAADRGLHLERPCSKPTSKLTGATSPSARL